MTTFVSEALNCIESNANIIFVVDSNHHPFFERVVWHNIIRSRFCRDVDSHLFYDVLVVIVAAARGEGVLQSFIVFIFLVILISMKGTASA